MTINRAAKSAPYIVPSDSISVVKGWNTPRHSWTTSSANTAATVRDAATGSAQRGFSAVSTFLSGTMAICASQIIGTPLKMIDCKLYNEYMAWTKESFALLVITITQYWSPTTIRVSGDDSMQDQLYQMPDGTLKCNFPHRLVLMANHQLYTDWLYLWWVAYCNKMHGRLYIIMKESLKKIPIFGWGAQFYNFIFLSRKWENDKAAFGSALNHLKSPADPMWLIIFPEGTNLSRSTRAKSAAWAKKNGTPDMKHQLLPRKIGLQFCLQELRRSTNWLYDCTIAYEGVPADMYGQDIFTLRSSFFEGRPPKSVNMFWRRFKVSDIPVDDDEAFGRWLINRWREKDYIIEYFYRYNHFPSGDPLIALKNKTAPGQAKMIETEVKAGGWEEFSSAFGPFVAADSATPSIDLTAPENFDALVEALAKRAQVDQASPMLAHFGSVTEKAFQYALQAAQTSVLIPQPILDTLMRQTPQIQKVTQDRLAASASESTIPTKHEKAKHASLPRRTNPTTSGSIATRAGQGRQKPAKTSTNIPPRNDRPVPRLTIHKTMPMPSTAKTMSPSRRKVDTGSARPSESTRASKASRMNIAAPTPALRTATTSTAKVNIRADDMASLPPTQKV